MHTILNYNSDFQIVFVLHTSGKGNLKSQPEKLVAPWSSVVVGGCIRSTVNTSERFELVAVFGNIVTGFGRARAIVQRGRSITPTSNFVRTLSLFLLYFNIVDRFVKLLFGMSLTWHWSSKLSRDFFFLLKGFIKSISLFVFSVEKSCIRSLVSSYKSTEMWHNLNLYSQLQYSVRSVGF